MKVASLLTIRVHFEQDVVTARGRAKRLAHLFGLGPQAQTRFATAVSELARNALIHGGGGRVEFLFLLDTQTLSARITDRGPGLDDHHDLLAEPSATPKGLAGTRRLVDTFSLESVPGRGTQVQIGLHIHPGPSLTTQAVSRLVQMLAMDSPMGPLEEVRAQNQELLTALDELAQREEQLQVLNRELEATNRGVVALYSDLEDKAEQLRKANQIKSMFLSYMSHEFRTPLNSVLGLTRLLLEQHDGPLNEEQQKQVTLAQGAARELLEMVNDLLDEAKVEAGHADVHVTTVSVPTLLSTLRALFQPLMQHAPVKLIIEELPSLPDLQTDEGKIGQILRNYVTNALKFTPRGEVRVGATWQPDEAKVEFHVRDTGIGIAREDQHRLFQDFTQIGPPRQGGGTGLGLSLTRKLAELLGGHVSMQSEPGSGSTFFVTIPVVYAPPQTATQPQVPSGGPRLLLIDDSETDRYILRTLLMDLGCQVDEAEQGLQGLARARADTPDAVVLDLAMPGVSGLEVLRALREDDPTRRIPVIVASAQLMNATIASRLEALGATFVPKQTMHAQGRETIRLALRDLLPGDPV